MSKAVATYRNTRNGKVFDVLENVKGGLYCHERNYKGLFPWGATFDYNEKYIDFAVKRRILIKTTTAG